MNLRTTAVRLKYPIFYALIIFVWLFYLRRSYNGQYDAERPVARPTSDVDFEVQITPDSDIPISIDKKMPSMLFMIRSTRGANHKVRDAGLNKAINEYCPFKCEYTMNRNRLSTIDGIFLQPSEITKDGPKRYSPKQTFFVFLREAPGQVYSQNYRWLPSYHINYTVGFVPGCDIYSGYDELVPKGLDFFGRRSLTANITDENEWEIVKQTAYNKTKGGFAVISHCETNSKREVYLAEFRKRYPELLSLHGKCYGGYCENCMEKYLPSHRFYFAFENAVCDNYVTEKFFRMKQLIVPVVLRKSDYVNIVPDHSYIAVDEFESMDALAKHLQFLIDNPNEYLKYFEWTRHFQRQSPNQIYRALCKSCEKLYQPNRQSFYKNMLEWFSPARYCDFDFVPRLFKEHTKLRNGSELSILA